MSTPLSSSDPSDIANAARCFSQCVPSGFYLPLKTHLLNQAVVAAQPPCITPSTPLIGGLIIRNNNSVAVKWTQPANHGSLITSYTVQLGTVSGGPYSFSKTLGAGARVVVFSGLSGGTTYYAIVTATSFAGCSATSAETSGTTPGCNFTTNAKTTAWLARLSGIPSQRTIDAANCFANAVDASGVVSWSDIIALNFFPWEVKPVASPLNDMMRYAYIKGPSGMDPWSVQNFIDADLNSNGLTGSGPAAGNEKRINTGINPFLDLASANNAGIILYESICAAEPASVDCGIFDSGNSQTIIGITNANNEGGTGAAIGDINIQATVASSGAGFYSFQRTSPTALNIYFANSTNPHSLIATKATANAIALPNSASFYLFLYNNPSVGLQNATATAHTFSIFALTQGLTAAKSAAWFALFQQLRQNLGGGFV